MKFLALLLVLASGTSVAAQSSEDSIEMCNLTLRLGMPQERVLQQLGQECDIQEMEGGTARNSTWLASEKGKPKNALGSVSFKQARLSIIDKYWTVDEPNTEAAYANALYGAIKGFEHEGEKVCTIKTGQSQNPRGEIKSMFISCGQKYIQLDVIRLGQQGESATVTEVLAQRQEK